jgi:hypothetical protein
MTGRPTLMPAGKRRAKVKVCEKIPKCQSLIFLIITSPDKSQLGLAMNKQEKSLYMTVLMTPEMANFSGNAMAVLS